MQRLGISWLSSWLVLGAPAAHAEDVWARAAEVGTVRVQIHWVSADELRAAARTVGKRPQAEPFGFSVLRKNLETGAYACDIYMPRQPTRVDDRVTNHLGHELAHCLGFSHE
jgi:hypothetical protein